MPSRPAPAPWAVPCGFSGFGGFPEGKIKRILLSLVHVYPGTSHHVFQFSARELSVILEFFHREVYVAVNFVGRAFFDQESDYFYDIADVFGDERFPVCPLYIQGVHIFVKLFDISFCQCTGVNPQLIGPVDDLVVNICKIPDIGDMKVNDPQISDNHVKHHH